ncbi:DUF2815 family protein [Xenorhabdus cabanillasii]|uniref:Phage protein n=1 Tax=Xenorhabdus cabanillasii JM26 TaxID=1427517 RepID=W1J9X4_9GAMM|nr:DUF2815 family protein [Xenorhabdus cabanillasii]PHM76930.1 hypothetical protein Xcab_02497 [Xenorhabdus cabanillasii JM26]CDL86300.1 putative protein p50 [Xenorhabdus cabanillasii JM26]
MDIFLKNVRLAFPDLWEATQVNGQGDLKYRSTLLIPKERKELIANIEAAILKVATDKWGAKAAVILKTIRGNNMRFNFRDGDDKPDYDGYAGNMYISASNKARPLVIDRDRTPLTAQDGKPYSGCYVNAKISIFAYDNNGKGISASLGGVQFFLDGDAFAGGGVASVDEFDEFDDLSEGADAEFAELI